MLPRRRTSRNPEKRKTSRLAPRPKRTSRGTVRRGLIKIGSVRAESVGDADPVFKGRIAVDRGAGVLEFPNPEQFRKIAREEGITKEEVDKAFGHLVKNLVKNARGKRAIAKGSIFTSTKSGGGEVPFFAVEVIVPDRFVTRIGASRAVMMDLGGEFRISRAVDGYRLAKPWVTKSEWEKAFGHLKGSLTGTTRRSRGIPLSYRARSMRLGHRDEAEEPVGGIVRGQLVLFHKPSGQIVWEAIDDSEANPNKPLLIILPGDEDEVARSAHVSLHGAMEGVRVGRGLRRSQPVGAVDLGIPPIAMVEAFGYLLSTKQRRRAFEAFARVPEPRQAEQGE